MYKITKEREAELCQIAAGTKQSQVYGPKDRFCVRDSQTQEVIAVGFENKVEAKFVRDILNAMRQKIAAETRKHVSHLVVSRGMYHWRGPSGSIPHA